MPNVIIFEHHKRQLAASAAARQALLLSRRDTVTITTAKASHTGRIYRVPLSTANVANELVHAIAREQSRVASTIAPIACIFMPGAAMRALGLSNGSIATLAKVCDTTTTAATTKVSATPAASLGQVASTSAKGKFNGKTLARHILEDIIPGLDATEFTSTDIANEIPGKTPSNINKPIHDLIDAGRIRVVRQDAPHNGRAGMYFYAVVTS